MSKFHDRVRAPKEDGDRIPAWFEQLFDLLPEVATVLMGTPKGPNGEPPVPPMSIIIANYKGTLQFTLSRKGDPQMYCGTIEDPKALLVSIEAALLAGEYDPVEKNGKGSSYKGQF